VRAVLFFIISAGTGNTRPRAVFWISDPFWSLEEIVRLLH
jgi:hypothetical protein